MEKKEVVGFYRPDTGKKTTSELRKNANIPAVLYGKNLLVHVYVPIRLIQDIIYTPNVCYIDLNVEGDHYDCIIQDIQFHPVSDVITHIDFLHIVPGKKIKMNIPIEIVGNAIGVKKGGKLVQKLKKLPISAKIEDMPDKITVDVSNLDSNNFIRVVNIEQKNFKVNYVPGTPIVSVEASRAARIAESQ